MENRNSKKDSKEIKTRISLKNLSKKQKELLTTVGIIGGGLGLGAGLFSLYSMKNPDETPGLSKEALSLNNSSEAENINANNSVDIIPAKPVTEIADQNISFSDAFKTAREITGPGGWFIWKGNVYNTYYKEEWETLSQGEKKEYLASIELHDSETFSDATALNNSENQIDEITSVLEETNTTAENHVDTSDHEFSIDFSALYEKPEDTHIEAPIEETLSQPDDLIYGEIINLDDDSDVNTHDFFELPDDIEITPISDDDLTQLDDSTFDSAEITEFPWASASENESDEISMDDPELNTDHLIGEVHDTASGESSHETDEYPWGEPIHQASETVAASSDQTADTSEEATNVLANASEIKEYPWGEPIESDQHETAQINSDQVVGELIGSDSANQINAFSGIEEYPWGEPVNQITETDPSLSDQANARAEQTVDIISDPAEIKEYPWGEPVELEQHDLSQIESDQAVGELIGSDSANQVNAFSDIEEYPWGEKNDHFVQASIDPSPDHENENIGVILPDEPELETNQELPTSFNDVTEFPWGETVPHNTFDEHTMPQGDILGDLTNHHLTGELE